MKKLTEMPERKGVWLSEYKDVKYKTGYQWFAEGVLAGLALLVGVGWGVQMWQATDVWAARIVVLFLPAVFCAYGLLTLPGAIIYLLRRRRGEPINVWDCETPDDPAVKERKRKT